jgi:nicotinate phosphoribosyltransferase
MILKSLLDTDLYKFTMMQVVLHHFPSAMVEYRFKCRNPDVDLAPYADEIREEIHSLCTLRFTPDELRYLRGLRFMKSDFIDLLELFKLNDRFVTVEKGGEPGTGNISITVKGPWLHTILFEIPILEIVSEVYYRNTHPQPDFSEGRRRLAEKIELYQHTGLPGLNLADYGARRRFSFDWQKEVLETLQAKLPGIFVGTSNVWFAKEMELTPLGTMAHEYLQACQAVGPRLRDSQTYALNMWSREYRGDLGIALSDVYGIDAFLRDFDLFFCKLFDGVRHDSGDPLIWGEKMIAHYEQMRVDPRTKTLIFSDGLNPDTALKIFRHFHGRVKMSFGIGTNFTNDVGDEALQNVVKMVKCNGQSVAKLSDSPEKTINDDPKYTQYLRDVFQMPA